jgi:hypothetical protein
MFDFFSGPIVSIVWAAIIALVGFLGLLGYGAKKKREGRAEMRKESQELVDKVEDEMKAEIKKPRTTTQTKKRLDKGNF